MAVMKKCIACAFSSTSHDILPANMTTPLRLRRIRCHAVGGGVGPLGSLGPIGPMPMPGPIIPPMPYLCPYMPPPYMPP